MSDSSTPPSGQGSEPGRPDHHLPDGSFRSPWLKAREDRKGGLPFLKWMWERLQKGGAPSVEPEQIPTTTANPARPRLHEDRIRVTWVGHSTFLIQCAGINLLTDPVFGSRASPLPIGPKRHHPPAIAVEELPPIDIVLLSHDHYDHLDLFTVRRLRELQGDTITWCTPLGYREWFQNEGVSRVMELDWWDSGEIEARSEEDETDSASARRMSVTCAPAQHWTRRGMKVNTRLWGSFSVRIPRLGGDGEHALYFGGDSGYFDGYTEIGQRLGPFALTLMPIGAYEPRWFMRRSHMNPSEAVQAFRDLGGEGRFAAMHWGTFQLTDEPPLEPPEEARRAWAEAGLEDERLHIPAVGETFEI